MSAPESDGRSSQEIQDGVVEMFGMMKGHASAPDAILAGAIIQATATLAVAAALREQKAVLDEIHHLLYMRQ